MVLGILLPHGHDTHKMGGSKIMDDHGEEAGPRLVCEHVSVVYTLLLR
jgi:hypothetical protein